VAKRVETPPTKITPQDLEDKFRALQGEIQGQVNDKKTSIATVAAGGGFVLLLIVFLLGRRSGKKRTAVVEIRRI
jgi:hypothetical protein